MLWNAPRRSLILLSIDLIVCVLSIAAAWVLFRVYLGQAGQLPSRAVLELVAFVLLCGVCAFALGLYRREALIGQKQQLGQMAGCAFLIIALALPAYCLFGSEVARDFLVAAPLAFAGLVGNRALGRRVLNSPLVKRRVVVIGTGPKAARIEKLHGQEYCPFYCVGYVQVPEESSDLPPLRILTDGNGFSSHLHKSEVDEIVIATSRRQDLPARTLVDCRLNGIPISGYDDFFAQMMGRVDLDYLEPDWFLVRSGFHAARLHRFAKRLIDVLLSLTLLCLCLPVFLTAAVAVWLEDRGAVFYRQVRVGQGGREFLMTKFRSMRIDAEADGVPRWSDQRDSRITHVGRFLRATHIDELPQLWSILKGDMSFVGPRPERPYFVKQLSEVHPYYLDRHAVKPGLTGWAQINFPYARSAGDARRKLEFDLFYVKYGTLLLDLAIVLQTARVVFKGAEDEKDLASSASRLPR
jgi:sugar transferase (PEP-CTERM system associated)